MVGLEQIKGFALAPDQFTTLLAQLSPDLDVTRTEEGLYMQGNSLYLLTQNENLPEIHQDTSAILLSSTVMKLRPKSWQFILTSVIASKPAQTTPEARVLLYTEDALGRALFEAIRARHNQLTRPANQPYV